MSGPYKLKKIDALSRGKHGFLEESDVCYYFGEYIGKDDSNSDIPAYMRGPCNQLIKNLQYSPSFLKERPDLVKHKVKAIDDVVGFLGPHLDEITSSSITVVPVPPSKTVGHEDYDDRLLQVLQQCNQEYPNKLNILQLVINTKNYECSRSRASGERPSVDALCEVYKINSGLTPPFPKIIMIFDDVLTIGAHFKAMQRVISSYYKNAGQKPPIITGLFIARTMHIEKTGEDYGFRNESLSLDTDGDF